MSTTASTTWQFLERDPKSSLKQLSIKGRRIRARTLYGRYMSEEEPRTIEEIATDYELPIEAVREAIAYCQSDPPEIREDIACEEALMKAAGLHDPKFRELPNRKRPTPQEVAQIQRAS
jgi:uncharacterized protein (DUF433 family)